MIKDTVEKNKLTRDYILKFTELHQIEQDQLINININNSDFFSIDITDFKSGLLPDKYKDIIKEDDIITASITDYELSFYGYDYLWWTNHKNTLTKLFKSTTKVVKEKKEDDTFTVACANLTENGLEEIKSCIGNKKELINFIDSEVKRRELQSFREAIVVFKFFYTEEDNHDPLVWSTIEELVERGVIILK